MPEAGLAIYLLYPINNDDTEAAKVIRFRFFAPAT